jgi:hypothetical protein
MRLIVGVEGPFHNHGLEKNDMAKVSERFHSLACAKMAQIFRKELKWEDVKDAEALAEHLAAFAEDPQQFAGYYARRDDWKLEHDLRTAAWAKSMLGSGSEAGGCELQPEVDQHPQLADESDWEAFVLPDPGQPTRGCRPMPLKTLFTEVAFPAAGVARDSQILAIAFVYVDLTEAIGQIHLLQCEGRRAWRPPYVSLHGHALPVFTPRLASELAGHAQTALDQIERQVAPIPGHRYRVAQNGIANDVTREHESVEKVPEYDDQSVPF